MTINTHTLAGTWNPVRAELDGEHAPAMALEAMELVITSDTYAISFGGTIHDRGSLAHSTTDSLILTAKHGEHKGRVVEAIYQLAGNRLRICFALDGTTPTEFVTAPNSGRYMVTYRRQET